MSHELLWREGICILGRRQFAIVCRKFFDSFPMQAQREPLLGKRFRYYQAVLDVRELPARDDYGRQEGREEGSARFAALASRLIEAGRVDDLAQAASDPVRRDELFREFDL